VLTLISVLNPTPPRGYCSVVERDCEKAEKIFSASFKILKTEIFSNCDTMEYTVIIGKTDIKAPANVFLLYIRRNIHSVARAEKYAPYDIVNNNATTDVNITNDDIRFSFAFFLLCAFTMANGIIASR
jgi:hypothetical protein